jgi:phosphatidylinositol phospholipase C, delta
LDSALRKLYSIRQELMSGLGNVEMRQAVWEKQYWKGADDGKDEKLDFEETERLCKRLNVNSSTDALLRLFKVRVYDVVYTSTHSYDRSQQADVNNRGYLDFPQFQRFVKMLKARPELDRLYKKICSANNRLFDFPTFEVFMRNSQQVSISPALAYSC